MKYLKSWKSSRVVVWTLLLLVVLGVALQSTVNGLTLPKTPFPAPEFTQSEKSEWINSKPLKISELRGKVVLIDFWTFACWNCYRSFPWLNALEKKYQSQDFAVVGIHTPEFDYDKVHANIIEKVKEFKLHHPVMVDNDFAYWRAMNNHYWPAFYLIDKRGVVRHVYVGETHEGSRRARAIEASIRQLLAENKGS